MFVLRPPALCLLVLLWSATSVTAQPPVSPASAAPSVARDVDIDLMTSHVAFDADGRRVAELAASLRVHTPAGVQQTGTLSIPFRQGAGTLVVKYVRVRKPDGRQIETPTTGFFDLPSPIAQAAPTYSDVYVRHINVQALQPGDTLEYAWEMNEPSLIPGHFWLTDTLDLAPFEGRRVIEVSWPSNVRPIVKSGRRVPDVVTSNGRTTYRWDSDVPAAGTEDDDRKDVVRVTSFRDWAEVGVVIRDLWRDRAEVTPEIRDKALELTKDLTSNDAKARALYRYVSTNVRYVAVAIGLGRIRPNPAATVLANGFGDCKDKHVLLEALLRAVDIDATPVLIGPGGDVDRDVPSFDQFTHVITLVDRGLPDPVWLDATIEVAPFGFLIAAERDATVLAVPPAGAPVLMTTPVRAQVDSSWRTETTGRINDDGQLQATVREEVTGDLEVLMRMTFRSVGRQQWDQIVRALPLGRLRGGTVADVVITPPEDTEAPFRIEYRYTADKFVDWSRGTLYPPVAIDLPELPSDSDKGASIDLGPIGTLVAMSRIELPDRIEITSEPGEPVELSHPAGRHRFQWSSNGRVIEAERELSSTAEEVPAAGVDAYREFVTAVRAVPTWVRVSRITPWAWGAAMTTDWYENASASTRKILGDAAATARKGDYQQAMVDVRRVLDEEPESDAAWQMLAWMQLSSGSGGRAFDTLQRRAPLTTGPSLLKYYAARLLAAGRRDEAADVLRSARERFPDDREIALHLAETLVAIQRGAEAVPLLLPLAERQQDSARYHLTLARAQFAAKNPTVSVAAFLRSAELDEGASHLNLIAWELAQRGIALDDAVRFAERSVRVTSEQIAALKVETVDAPGLRLVASLPRRWDTLGWVHYRRGDFATAIRYLEAAWQVSQDPVIARNLLVVHAESGNREVSTRYSEYADARDSSSAAQYANRPEFAWRVEAVAKARVVLAREWTVDLPADLGVTTPIDTLVLLDRDGRVRDVRFVGTSVSGSAVSDALRAITVPWTAPDEHVTQMLRRGIVSCAQGACSLQLRSTGDAAAGLSE